MKRFTYLLLLLSPFFAFTQKRLDLVHNNAFAYYDYQEKAFCVLDDSTFIWKYNAKKEKWEKSPVELRLEMPFVKFLTDFIPLSDKGTPVYFVYGGCGVVYAKKGKVIQRHDHSFYHKNQFGGAFFMDEGEPRIYGGYGLFTSKNIVTRYDTIEREWFMLNTSQNMPPAGVKHIINKYNNGYFIFNGFRGTSNQFHSFDNVWRLDLETKKWIKLGQLNDKIKVENIESYYESFQMGDKGFICFSNMITSYDFKLMRYRKYKFSSTGLYKNIIKIGSLFLVFKTTTKPSRFIEMTDSTLFNQFEFEEGGILMNEKNEYSQFVIAFPFILLLIYVMTTQGKRMKRIFRMIPPLKSVSYFNEFNQTELDLLKLLIVHQETGLEISYINDLVNHDQPSIDTLKKRREILLKDLRYKLASKFNISKEEVFIERRMENDKRMKLLFLNELIKMKI
jgi:hypothetical protein